MCELIFLESQLKGTGEWYSDRGLKEWLYMESCKNAYGVIDWKATMEKEHERERTAD